VTSGIWAISCSSLVLLIGLTVAAPLSTAGATQADAGPVMLPIGTLRATFHDPSAMSDDQFGYAIAKSGTGSGSTVIVGAYGGSRDGVAYIYVKDRSRWPSTPTATLNDPAGAAGDNFSISVAVSGDIAVVGADGTKSNYGAAYLYVKGFSGWPTAPTATLEDPAGASSKYRDQFGVSVAVSGNTAFVGSNNVNCWGWGCLHLRGRPIRLAERSHFDAGQSRSRSRVLRMLAVSVWGYSRCRSRSGCRGR
jgi:hypothetical protein